MINGDAAEFLPLFLEEAAGRLDVIFEALEDGSAQTPEQLETLMREAHTLKGSSGIVGLAEIEQIAHALEDLLSDAREAGSGLDDESMETVRRLAGAIRRRLDDVAAPAPAQEIEADAPVTPKVHGDGVRVAPEKIDRLLDLVGETVLQQRRVLSSIDDAVDHELAASLELTETMLEELQDSALQIRILPITTIVRPLRRALRQLADAHGKQAELVVEGLDAELDRTLLEGLADSLTHIVRNAVAHGIETPDERLSAGKPAKGTVRLSAVQREHGVEVTVSDDGRGVARELLAQAPGGRALAELLAEPGMSTAAEVTELSGRGVGMDAVRRYVAALGGDVSVDSTPGAGTEIRLRLPQTLTLLDVLLIVRGRSLFGLPLGSVREVGMHDSQALCGEPRLALEDLGPIPYRDLADVLALEAAALTERPQTVIMGDDERHVAVGCDRLIGEEQVVVKSLALPGISVEGYIGAAILGDGQIALILDPHLLTQPRHAAMRARAVAVEERTVAPKALVVEDSFTIRELQRSILEAAGYRVTTARDGADALRRLDSENDVSIVITDLEMPELDGFGLIESVRRDDRRSALPIVIVSSLEDDDARRRAGALGADAFVVKRAYDQTALLETVEQLVGR